MEAARVFCALMGFGMKQGATKLRRVPETAEEIAAMPARASADSAAATRAIPVNLMPLISAYRKRGRFMLRIENLPQHARFSAGQNNGDGSWSLALDELDELVYFVPKNAAGGDHSLSIRLVAKNDTEAFTLALIDFPVPGLNERESAGFPKSIESGSDQLRADLQEAQNKLAARESELSQLRASAERMGVLLQQKIDLAVAEAETRWKREESGRLATEKARLEGDIEQRLAERESRVQAIADIAREQQAAQIRRLAQELGTAQELSAAREVELAASRAALERVRAEMEGEVAAAHQADQAKIADALKNAEGEWQARAGKALAEMTAKYGQAEAALAKSEAALAKSEAALAAADASGEVQQLRAELENLRRSGEADAAALKAQAESRLAQALKSAETEWQARAGVALVEMKARAEAAEAALAVAEKAGPGRDAEIGQLRADLERQRFQLEMDHLSAKVALEEKSADALKAAEVEWQARTDKAVAAVTRRAEQAEAALAQARAAAQPNADREIALGQLRHELEHQRVKAQEDNAAVRAAAESKAAEAEAALSEMTARAQAAEAALAGTASGSEHEIAANQLRRELEHQRVKAQGELAVANAALEARLSELAAVKTEAAKSASDREAEMTQLRAEFEQKGKAAEAAMVALKTAAEKEVAEKLKAAESRWQKERSMMMSEMTERTEAAEATLARAKRLDAAKADDDAYVHSLEREIKSLRATLADREISIVQSQAMQEHSRLGTMRDTPGSRWQPLMSAVGGDPEERAEGVKSRRQLFRDVAVVVVVAAAAVILFPKLEGMLPDTLRWQIETLGGTRPSIRSCMWRGPSISGRNRRSGHPSPQASSAVPRSTCWKSAEIGTRSRSQPPLARPSRRNRAGSIAAISPTAIQAPADPGLPCRGCQRAAAS
jgi:hypothetical protein